MLIWSMTVAKQKIFMLPCNEEEVDGDDEDDDVGDGQYSARGV